MQAAMRVERAFNIVKKLFGQRQRRSTLGRTRAQIELRELDSRELEALERALQQGFSELERVRWIDVCPEIGRVIISFEDDAYTLSELVAVVENAERSTGVHEARFVDGVWEHPADEETAERVMVGIVADAVSAVVGSGLRLSIVPASRLAGTAASLLAIVQTSARMRRPLDEKLGPNRADLVMNTGAAFFQGLAQRPGSAFVELVHKSGQLASVRARRRSFEQREPELFARPRPNARRSAPIEARPRPLPAGPIEEYADRAWIVSLGGFAVSLIATRSVQRAVAALFGGLPKPARHGREAFTAYLEVELSRRGALVMDREAMRRLDRLDCIVLEASLVARDRFEVRSLIAAPELDELEARRLVQARFDPSRPLGRVEREGYALEPLGPGSPLPPPEMLAQGLDLGARGGLVLCLSRGGAVQALVEVEWIAQTGIEELVAAAREARMRVVIAADDEAVLQGFAADDTIPAGEGMVRGIRRLQREGRGVLVVTTESSPALAAADCSIGLLREGEPPPWGAHVICRYDLSDVRFLIFACVAARQVSRRGVNIALGAATLGALVSAGGVLPLTARRVIAVVNLASLVSMANGTRSGILLARRELPPPRDRTPWHALDARGVLHKLGTADHGLTRREANERRRGTLRPRSALGEVVEAVSDELFNPLAPLLAAGAGLSAAVGSLGDAAMVGSVVLVSALAGGVIRYRTERAIRDLGRATRRRALTRRAGQLMELDATELVRGDIVLVAAGDVVPADCRVLESEALEVDASAITGESLPVTKAARASFEQHLADRTSMLYEGSVVAAGRATAVVVAVGDETEARRGAVARKSDASRGGVERRLRSLIDLTGPIALGAGVTLVASGLLRGRKLDELVGSGVSLAVASVPEGLPLLATAAQLASAARLSKKGALVRNVRSIEALGRVDTICLDKTGTLTEGHIELDLVSDGRDSYLTPDLPDQGRTVLGAALRASGLSETNLDPTDRALARIAARLAVGVHHGRSGFERLRELPYEAGRGFHATLGRAGSERVLTVKGAPEVVLGFATDYRRADQSGPIDLATAAALNQHASELGRRGYRVLAVAERVLDGDAEVDLASPGGLVFLGLIGFRDPVRKASGKAISDLSATGIRTVMITGDHPSTARSVAEEVGLLVGRAVITGGELSELSDEELDRRINGIGVFARVTPPQKVRVVRALQRAGRVVAMVGDGANDAPAIRLANVGIAIGERSTGAAQAAADIVLTDERVETLAEAVWEGRAMWSSVRDAVAILVGGNLGEIGFTLAAGLVDGRPPLNARQLLLVNLLTDVAPAMAIALRPPSVDSLRALSQEGPERSLGQRLSRDIVSRASVTALGAGSAWLVSRLTAGHERAGTVGLVALVGTQLGQTLLSGEFSRSVVITSAASSLALAAMVQTPGVSHAFGCRPLGPLGWATALSASASATVLANYFPSVVDSVARRLRLNRALFVEDPDAVPAPELVGPAVGSMT
jgi:cation-transporting P-type ATPase I